MTVQPNKSEGQVYEGIAFTFCKCATVALLCGRFTLPAAAFLSAAFYIAAYVKGERGTRCILGPPLVVASVWLLVGSLSLVLILNPAIGRSILDSLHLPSK